MRLAVGGNHFPCFDRSQLQLHCHVLGNAKMQSACVHQGIGVDFLEFGFGIVSQAQVRADDSHEHLLESPRHCTPSVGA